MAKEFFVPTSMRDDSLKLVRQMISVIEDYQRQGYSLSLRQLYYQLVTKNIIENKVSEYKRIGTVLSDARLNGWVDWSAIEDRGRDRVVNSHWNHPSEIIKNCEAWYRRNMWKNQPWHVEVMVEKEALAGVLGPVCRRLDVPFSANKGYSSSSALYYTGKSLKTALEAGKNIRIFYLGDHDPSGQDMTRDVKERLEIFASYHFYQPKGSEPDDNAWREAFSTMNPRRFKRFRNASYSWQQFIVDRLALNMDQIERYNPPPNPAKLTDTRAKEYVAKYGDDSWELDALEPSVLANILESNILAYRDEEIYSRDYVIQQEHKNVLRQVAIRMAGSKESFEDGTGI